LFDVPLFKFIILRKTEPKLFSHWGRRHLKVFWSFFDCFIPINDWCEVTLCLLPVLLGQWYTNLSRLRHSGWKCEIRWESCVNSLDLFRRAWFIVKVSND
jgi:hypothetical protein